jgi:hypothetical protein
MTPRKEQIITEIKRCPSIIEFFGNEFILTSIETYQTVNGFQWSPRNYFISNYFMSISFYQNQPNFITELERLLHYYLTNYPALIKSKNVISRLTTKDESLFQGKWSELIFGYFLAGKGIEIIDISRTQQSVHGEIELFDIKTKYGEIEVTAIMTKEGRIFDTNEVFIGSLQIDDFEKRLVNKKIKKKSGKKILAIDSSLIDELQTRILESSIGINVDFDVFQPTSKEIILFLRNPETCQVGHCKFLNRSAG